MYPESRERPVINGDYSLRQATGTTCILCGHYNGSMVHSCLLYTSPSPREKMLDDRVGRLEEFKEQELEAVNKSLLQKVLGGNDD